MWWLIAALAALADRIFTFAYFIPRMVGLLRAADSSGGAREHDPVGEAQLRPPAARARRVARRAKGVCAALCARGRHPLKKGADGGTVCAQVTDPEVVMRMLTPFALAALCLASTPAFAQLELPRPSPFAKVRQTVGLTEITVDYSSPGGEAAARSGAALRALRRGVARGRQRRHQDHLQQGRHRRRHRGAGRLATRSSSSRTRRAGR